MYGADVGGEKFFTEIVPATGRIVRTELAWFMRAARNCFAVVGLSSRACNARNGPLLDRDGRMKSARAAKQDAVTTAEDEMLKILRAFSNWPVAPFLRESVTPRSPFSSPFAIIFSK